jgi:plastocyanin
MRHLNHILCATATAGLMAIALACGSSSSTSTSPTSTTPTSTTTITIANNAVSPSAIVVTRGAQVTFVNADSRTHEMYYDPHPDHTDCPEINQVGFLNPGQSRQTGNLNTVRTCGFHDHGSPDTNSLKGTITIQ